MHLRTSFDFGPGRLLVEVIKRDSFRANWDNIMILWFAIFLRLFGPDNAFNQTEIGVHNTFWLTRIYGYREGNETVNTGHSL